MPAFVQEAASRGMAVNLAALHKSCWMMKLALVRGDGGAAGTWPCGRRGGGMRLPVPVNRVVAPGGAVWGLVTC